MIIAAVVYKITAFFTLNLIKNIILYLMEYEGIILDFLVKRQEVGLNFDEINLCKKVWHLI